MKGVTSALEAEIDARGHLTEAGVALLADGQPVSDAARLHAETCEACASRLAEAALVSGEIQRALVDLAEAPLPVAPEKGSVRPERRQPSALPYVAVGFAVTLLASLPTLSSVLKQAVGVASGARLQAAGLGQAGRVVVFQVSAPVWSLGVAFVLVVMGLAVAWWGSRSRSKGDGGTRHGFA